MKDPTIDYNEVKAAYLEPLKLILNEETTKFVNQLNSADQLFSTYVDKLKRIESKNGTVKFINETDWLKSELYELVEECYPPIEILSLEDFFEKFYIKSNKNGNVKELELQCIQNEERFQKLITDSIKIGYFKSLKRIGFSISKSPLKIANFFRKDKAPIKRWSHNIPLRRIYFYFFQELFLSKVLEYYEKKYQERAKLYGALWNIDKELNIVFTQFLNEEEKNSIQLIDSIQEKIQSANLGQIEKSLRQEQENTESDLSLIFNDLIDKAEEAISKVDTLELNRNRFSEGNIRHLQKNNQKEFLRIENGWRNTLFSQLDDFELDLELFHFKYLNLKQQSLVNDSCRLRITNTINDSLSPFENQFKDLEKEVKKAKSKSDLLKLLSERKKEINKKLELVIIPKASEAILNQNLPGLIDRMETTMQKQISKVKEVRLIYPNNNYGSPTKNSELNRLNPREIIEVSIFNPNIKKFQEIKSSLVQKLEEIQIYINDLAEIVDYNLESALEANNEEIKLEGISQISLEGLERVQSKHQEVKSSLSNIEQWLKAQLDLIVKDINTRLIELTDQESISKVKLDLAKARAIEKSAIYKKELLEKVKAFIPKTIALIKEKYVYGLEKLDIILKQSGLRKEDSNLSSELSEFLTDTEKVLNNLPYVYRRLYQIYPLLDDSFFIGRDKEIESLKDALENWKKGIFSACIIHGEKGSGISSLINNFSQEIHGIEILKHQLNENITSEEGVFKLLKELIKDQKSNSFDSLITAVNFGKKRVCILEDANHLFLKKVDGFIAIERFLEFVTSTSDQIFWIVEMNSFSYQYLSKTIAIEQYFKNIVQLQALTDQQIIDLILKRHRVSGYNIEFLSIGLNIQERKKLKKLNQDQRQHYLKQQFFGRLNEFSQSNISLALLFWLRSTRKVEKNTIYLERLPKLKFDFLKNLNNDIVFTLYILILHSSITAEDYATLMQISEDKAKRQLLVLEERGVLRLNESRYRINQLLYRQIVTMLQNRNIIH